MSTSAATAAITILRRRFFAALPFVKPLPLLDITDPQTTVHSRFHKLIRTSAQNVPDSEYIDEQRRVKVSPAVNEYCAAPRNHVVAWPKPCQTPVPVKTVGAR